MLPNAIATFPLTTPRNPKFPSSVPKRLFFKTIKPCKENKIPNNTITIFIFLFPLLMPRDYLERIIS